MKIYETKRGTLEYRIRETNMIDAESGAKTWFFEYDQAGNGDWGPRGTCLEIDGRFHWGDLSWDSAYEALLGRVQAQP